MDVLLADFTTTVPRSVRPELFSRVVAFVKPGEKALNEPSGEKFKVEETATAFAICHAVLSECHSATGNTRVFLVTKNIELAEFFEKKVPLRSLKIVTTLDHVNQTLAY
jgi:hypothetical protein